MSDAITLSREEGQSIIELSKSIKAGMTKAAEGYADTQTKLGKVVDSVGELHGKYDQITEAMGRLEKRGVFGPSVPPTRTEVLQQRIAAANWPKSLNRGEGAAVQIGFKDILNQGRTWAVNVPQIDLGPRFPTSVWSLIPTTPTTAGAVHFMQETSFTNNAAFVAEGAAKPKSEKTFAQVTLPMETIAHYFKVSKRTYEDIPQMAATLDSNLIYGLELKIDGALLKGTGVAPQIAGLYTFAAAGPGVISGGTLVDQLLAAVAQLATTGYRANGIVVSGADYFDMIGLKDTTGRYLFTGADGGNVPLPRMVWSPALAAGEYLVGDFTHTHVHLREAITVAVATQNEDDFTHNLYTALGECVLAQAIGQPGAFLKNPA